MEFKINWFFLALLVLVFLGIFTGCSKSPLKEEPDFVFLITLDTLRADYVSCFPEAKASTPTLEEFAHQGIVVAPTYSPIPITAPAHAVIFYSLPPHQLKLYNNGQIFNPPPLREKSAVPKALSEIFRRRHFETAAFVSLGVLKSKFGLARGFDYYLDSFPEERWYLTAEEINQRFFSWLDNFRGQRAFLWLHYSDPHDPYAPPNLPADVAIIVNGQDKKTFSLQKMEPIEVGFMTQPGENKIEIKVLKPHPEGQIRVRLSQVKIFSSQKEISFFQIKGADSYEKKGKKFWLVKDRAVLSFLDSGPPRPFKFQAQGEIFLTIEEKRKAYQAEVEYLDAQLKILREKLISRGIYQQSLFILVGDHGEGLGERRTRFGDFHFGHIHFLYDNYLRVPFIISSPLLEQTDFSQSGPASLLDVAPTLMKLLGWPTSDYYQGRNILEKINSPAQSFIFLETYRPEAVQDRFGGISYPWHLVFTPARARFELYNLEDDPAERQNLHSSSLLRPEWRALYRQVTATALKILEEKKETLLDPQAKEMLRSLGYIK